MSATETKDGTGANNPTTATTFVSPSERKLYDPAVTFEEYVHYAQRTREEEKIQQNIPTEDGILQQVFRRKSHVTDGPMPVPYNNIDNAEKAPEKNGHAADGEGPQPRRKSILSRHSVITDDEWRNASRALRTASWGAGFYLITTDILGPYGVGFALGTLGWGPGVALYTVFAFMAGYSGYLLWQVYLGLDSYEYPLRNYGDLAYRTMGTVARYVVNILQSIQLLLICGQVIIQNGQGISQTSKFRLCYAVCVILFVIAGFFMGQVRTLRNFGVFSMLAVGINLLVIFISMGVMAHSPPNYAISVLGSAGSAVNPDSITPDANGVYPPIIHYGGMPDSGDFVGAINGLMSGVFAYGGAQLFVEIMAEMRRPWDFIKAMWSAQFFIYAVYLIYGCYVYHYQGQYSFTIAYMGLSPYGFQAACDMLVVISGLIAAGLYGNIGIKVLYNQVLQELFGAPPLTTKNGKYLFASIVPIYWSIAFVVAAAIPDYFGFVSVIAAFCIVQFSYSFPPIIHLAYTMQRNSMTPDSGFNPTTGQTNNAYRGLLRLWKGFWADKWYVNVWHVIHAGGALATAGLGAYAAIQGMIEAFKNPQVNSFTCRSPLDLSAFLGVKKRPDAPNCPLADKPFEQFLWLLKHQMMLLVPEFKQGAFQDKITWKAKLVDCFDILLTSPLLDKHEKGVLLETIDGIERLADEHQAPGKKMTCEEMCVKHRDTFAGFFMMVQLDRAVNGMDVISEELRKGALANLSFEGKCKDFGGLGVIEEET